MVHKPSFSTDPNPAPALSRAQQLLLELAGMYDHTITDGESFIWSTQVFQKHESDRVFNALMAWATSSERFFPRPGAILALLEPHVDVSVIERAVQQYGPYQTPRFESSIIHAAIAQLGGWQAVCAQLPDASADPVGHDRYLKRIDKSLSEARRQVKVLGQHPTAPVGLLEQHGVRTSPAMQSALASLESTSEAEPEAQGNPLRKTEALNAGLQMLRSSAFDAQNDRADPAPQASHAPSASEPLSSRSRQ